MLLRYGELYCILMLVRYGETNPETHSFSTSVADEASGGRGACGSVEGLHVASPYISNMPEQSPPLHTLLQALKTLLCSGVVLLLQATDSGDFAQRCAGSPSGGGKQRVEW